MRAVMYIRVWHLAVADQGRDGYFCRMRIFRPHMIDCSNIRLHSKSIMSGRNQDVRNQGSGEASRGCAHGKICTPVAVHKVGGSVRAYNKTGN